MNTICTAIVKTSNESNICISNSVKHYSEKSFSQLRNVGEKDVAPHYERKAAFNACFVLLYCAKNYVKPDNFN